MGPVGQQPSSPDAGPGFHFGTGGSRPDSRVKDRLEQTVGTVSDEVGRPELRGSDLSTGPINLGIRRAVVGLFGGPGAASSVGDHSPELPGRSTTERTPDATRILLEVEDW